MDYSYKEPPLHHNGGAWFGHQISLFVKFTRKAELLEFVEQIAGPRGLGFRTLGDSDKLVLRFADKRTAIHFKLTWDPCIKPEKHDLNKLYKSFRQISVANFFNISAVRGVGKSISLLNSATPGIEPSSNIPSTKKLRQPCDIFFLDMESYGLESDWTNHLFGPPTPLKSVKGCKQKGHTVMTTEQLMEKLARDS